MTDKIEDMLPEIIYVLSARSTIYYGDNKLVETGLWNNASNNNGECTKYIRADRAQPTSEDNKAALEALNALSCLVGQDAVLGNFWIKTIRQALLTPEINKPVSPSYEGYKK